VANNSRLAWKLTGRVFSGPRGGDRAPDQAAEQP